MLTSLRTDAPHRSSVVSRVDPCVLPYALTQGWYVRFPPTTNSPSSKEGGRGCRIVVPGTWRNRSIEKMKMKIIHVRKTQASSSPCDASRETAGVVPYSSIARDAAIPEMAARSAHPRLHSEDGYSEMRRLNAERRLASVERQRARRAVSETAARLKDEVAHQIAQICDDRAYGTRPTFQIPNNWRCTHFPERTIMYKVVACVNDTFVSVYDGNTVYELGKTYKSQRGAAGWPPLDQCFFAYREPVGALQAGFPKGSVAKHYPRVLLKIETKGNAYEQCVYQKFKGNATQKPSGKTAVTSFRVMRVMTDAFRESALDKLRFGDEKG